MEGYFRKHLPPPFVPLPSSKPGLPCVQVGSQAPGPRRDREETSQEETTPVASWRVWALLPCCTPLTPRGTSAPSCSPTGVAPTLKSCLPAPSQLLLWLLPRSPLVSLLP